MLFSIFALIVLEIDNPTILKNPGMGKKSKKKYSENVKKPSRKKCQPPSALSAKKLYTKI